MLRIGRVILQSNSNECAFIHDFLVTIDGLNGDIDDLRLKVERNEINGLVYILKNAKNNAECLNKLSENIKGELIDYGYK